MNDATASAKPTRAPSPSSLRTVVVLPRRAALRLRPRLLRACGRSAQTALQVVEDEPDGRLGRRRRGDQPAVVADDEDAPLGSRDLDLVRRGGAAKPGRGVEQLARRADERLRARLVREGGGADVAVLAEERGGLDLRRDLGEIG